MSHIHIPDGVLPAWLTVLGWVAALALVWGASAYAKRGEVRRRVPLLGVVSAFVLVSMSSEIVPIAYHINLTVVAGVLLGPALSIVCAFIVEVVLALLGHGGVTVIGLNTLMIGGEMLAGWVLFRLLSGLLGRRRVRAAAAISTVVALATTTAALVGIVALAGGGMAASRETGALDPGSLRFVDPFGGGVFAVNTLRAEPGGEEPGEGFGGNVGRFATVILLLAPAGWAIEATVTALVLGYVARVRPSLVFAGGAAAPPRPAGDEGAH